MKPIHWFSAVAIAIGTCQLLCASDIDSVSQPTDAISKSGELTMDQVHFVARSLKKKKRHRSRKRPAHRTSRPPAYRNIDDSHSANTFGKTSKDYNSYGSYGDYSGYSAPYYGAPTTYTQPIIYSGDYGSSGYFKPLIFLLIIPLVIIVAAGASVAVINSSSSSTAAAASNQQQQQQENNNNNNNANNDNNNNNAAVAVVSSNTATTYTSPVIIIINATGRANDEKLDFVKPTWLGQFFD